MKRNLTVLFTLITLVAGNFTFAQDKTPVSEQEKSGLLTLDDDKNIWFLGGLNYTSTKFESDKDRMNGASANAGVEYRINELLTMASLLRVNASQRKEDNVKVTDRNFGINQELIFNFKVAPNMILQPFVGVGLGYGQIKGSAKTDFIGDVAIKRKYLAYDASVGVKFVVAKFVPFIKYSIGRYNFDDKVDVKIAGQDFSGKSTDTEDAKTHALMAGVAVRF